MLSPARLSSTCRCCSGCWRPRSWWSTAPGSAGRWRWSWPTRCCLASGSGALAPRSERSSNTRWVGPGVACMCTFKRVRCGSSLPWALCTLRCTPEPMQPGLHACRSMKGTGRRAGSPTPNHPLTHLPTDSPGGTGNRAAAAARGCGGGQRGGAASGSGAGGAGGGTAAQRAREHAENERA